MAALKTCLTAGSELKTEVVAEVKSRSQDQLSWNITISQHAKSGRGRMAIRMYEDMRKAGVEPDSYTYMAVLKACRSLHDLESGKKIHAHMVEAGLDLNVFVGSVLVDLYAKIGSLVDARSVFEKIPHRNVVSWTAMILGYAQKDEGQLALQMYARMQQEGVVPDDRIFVAALKGCSALLASKSGPEGEEQHRRRCLEQVRRIHLDIRRSRSESDVFVGTMLVDVYAKCGSLVDAREVFERMPRRDVASWTAIILAYAHAEEGAFALKFFAQMQQAGVVPDERTFVGALKACCSLAVPKVGNESEGEFLRKGSLEQVQVLHEQIVKGRFEKDLFVGTMLVDTYAKLGSLVDAKCVFNRMTRRNVVSWNSMIMGYAQVGDGEEALQLYAQMLQECVVPDERTLVGALRACGSMLEAKEANCLDAVLVKKRCLERVRSVHSDILRWDFESDVFVGTMLVDVYAKCESLVDARQVFEKMPYRDVVSWNAMILAYAQVEDGEAALKLYEQMQRQGLRPNERTYVGALKACGVIAGLDRGKTIHAEILKAGIAASDLFVSTSLIDMYSKCGSMENAQQVFDQLSKKDVVAWNALIAGYANQGEIEAVEKLFRQMGDLGLQPSTSTFASVLNACSHGGLVDKGHAYFTRMSKDFGITPTLDHYTCMVDLLGRAGHVEKALAMVTTMPWQPDTVLWSALLGACCKWRNLELGRHAFRCAVQLGNIDASMYVMMSNMYAAAHMWEDAKQVHATRVESGVTKKRGQSQWTDIDGTVYSFRVEDTEHAQSQQAYAQLQELVSMMQEQGYMPRLDSIMLDEPEEHSGHNDASRCIRTTKDITRG